jgi:hypothetical protein
MYGIIDGIRRKAQGIGEEILVLPCAFCHRP